MMRNLVGGDGAMNTDMDSTDHLERAAAWLRDADGMLVTAGAGMGVDSGLPDFRGTEGLWHHYPALAHARLDFTAIANPVAFSCDPELAWGFYGHRLQLYRETIPHAGFAVLARWAERMPQGAFVFTSNVDGQFQRAGFADERVAECHGSIHHMQCTRPCSRDIWPAAAFEPQVDAKACRLVNALPRCPNCGEIARPNVLMFGDGEWLPARTDEQETRLARWLQGVSRLVVVELGAGRAVPTVRRFSERFGPRVIRINLREPQIPASIGIGFAQRATDVLVQLDEALGPRA